MCCWLGCFVFFGARATLIAMWLTGYLGRAYETLLWPVLGFLFLPVTTITYAWVINSHGEVEGLYTVAVTLAVLFDLGVFASGRRGRDEDD
jgi:hypothetical protein